MAIHTLITAPTPVRDLAISGYDRESRIIYVDAEREAAQPLTKYGRVTGDVNRSTSWRLRVDARYDFDEVYAWVERLQEGQ
jgi:hypothetical protein